jgi:His-Xaa-Ser system radical SAM maturase HxsC
MLALHGHATSVAGFDGPETRHVLRLRQPSSVPQHPADTALFRTAADLKKAVENGFSTAVGIGSIEEWAILDGSARIAVLPSKFEYLGDGDIVGFHPGSKQLRTLYRRASKHNSFLVTERCNHYCLMCSQPPKNIDDSWILREIRQALALVDKQTISLGFTGGEPLLDWREFVDVLTDCRVLLPETAVHVLSNGRGFASNEVVDAWASVRHPDLMVGIPIYSAVDTVHDYVVQAKGALDETVLGILKLKDRGQRVEIRVVLHAITAPRIIDTCRWLACNLPFVDHVALMGLENTGFAIANDDVLWIDPMDYRDQLVEAVDALAAARVCVSVYNLPRCVLAPSVWPYAAQSISDWKNDFVAECDRCDEKERCSGFFTTGRPRYSRGIQAITAMGNARPSNAVLRSL